MKADYRELLKPEILQSVKGLSLISQVIVDGYFSGLNHSRRVGAGLEFSQYRSYEPGDDLRLLDWKMLARSSRYYIKQSEIETNISVKFIIDASNSMLHTEDDLSKMDFIRVVVASLAYLAQQQGDAIGMFALNDQKLYSLYPKVQKQHFNRFLHQLIEIKNEGKWPQSPDSLEKLHDRRHKELIIVLTDLYEQNNELTSFIEGLKTNRNEVIAFQILGKQELDLSYTDAVTFEDLETGNKMKVDVAQVRSQYIKTLNDRIETLRTTLLQKGIDYEMFDMSNHIGELLSLFLKKRKQLM